MIEIKTKMEGMKLTGGSNEVFRLYGGRKLDSNFLQ